MNLKALTIGLLALSLLLPLQEAAALRLEFGIEPSYTIPLNNPIGDYYKQLNEDFRTGKYTFGSPISDWKDIETPNLQEFGGEGSCLAKLKPGKIKNPRVGIVSGYRISSSKSEYEKTYIINSHTSPIQRKEGINASTISLGARGKASLTDKLDASATVGVNFNKVKGTVNTTLRDIEYDYTQWRKADYKGKGTGLSLEAGATYEFRKNIWVGAALGYRTGRVKTKGKQVITATSNPGKTYIKDYSPEFNFNGAYGKFYFGIGF